jgi:ABC-type amino acid transport substrate-binding protein
VRLVTRHSSFVTRRWIILLFLLAGFGLPAFWLWPRDDGSLAAIQRRGTLRVGLDASFPPFEVVDGDGQIVGFDVDLARIIAADLGVQAELVNIGFDGLYDALLARRVDLVLSGLPYDPRWTQDVAYTQNYFNAGQALLTRADETAIAAPADLAGRTVAVEWGSQADMEARRLPAEPVAANITRHATAAEALAALLAGQADAAIVDGVTAVEAEAQGAVIVAYLTDEWYAGAVHIESTALLKQVNQTLTRLRENGELARLQNRWLQNNSQTH